MNNPFKSEISTNSLRGYPVAGKLLTVDIEEYWFDPEQRRKDALALPITIRVFEDAELTQVLNIEADVLVAFFLGSRRNFTKKWPNGSKERWTRSQSNGLVLVRGGYGNGSVLATEDEFRRIAGNAKKLIDGLAMHHE